MAGLLYNFKLTIMKKVFVYLKRSFAGILFLMLPGFDDGGQTTVHYASPTGTASWGQSVNPSTPCSAETAFAKASGDDEVVFTAGDYNSQIAPSNSGTPGHVITFRSASASGKARFYGQNINLNAVDKNYIVYKDLVIGVTDNTASSRRVYMEGCDFNVWDGVDFENAYSVTKYEVTWIYDCDHFEIKNGSFWMGEQPFETDNSGRNFLQFMACDHLNFHHNFVGDASHVALSVNSACHYAWIHHNTICNRYRHALCTTHQYPPYTHSLYQVIEYNLIYNNGALAITNTYVRNPLARPVNGIKISANNVIVRFNTIIASSRGIDYFTQNTGNTDYISDCSIYHNTIYNQKIYGVTANSTAGTGVAHQLYGGVDNDRWINNIICKTENFDMIIQAYSPNGSYTDYGYHNNLIGDQNGTQIRLFGTNYYDIKSVEAVDAGFAGNIGGVDPLFIDAQNYDLRLQNGSPCINAGRFLATIAAVNGNQLTLGANEAYAFADNMEITGRAGDTIYDDNGNSAVIASIDAHNKITLDNAAGFTANGKITVVKYSGTAPDIGRYESLYTGTSGIRENENHKGLKLYVYPNPSNGKEVTVAFKLPDVSGIIIRILDSSGKTMKILSDEKTDRGLHVARLNAKNYKPGMYFCELTAGNNRVVKKFIVP